MDQDGARTGYDLELTVRVAQSVAIPVIASGGAGNVEHLSQALREGQADAVLVAGVLHDKQMTVSEIKSHLQSRGISVRGSEAP
jgi:cyclase